MPNSRIFTLIPLLQGALDRLDTLKTAEGQQQGWGDASLIRAGTHLLLPAVFRVALC